MFHALEVLTEPGIAAKGIEERKSGIDEKSVPLLSCLVEEPEGSIHVAEGGYDHGQVQGSYVLFRRPFLELDQDRLRMIPLPSRRLGPAENSKVKGSSFGGVGRSPAR